MPDEYFENKYLRPFEKCHYISNDTGHIVWRLGTGANTELLHIRTTEPGRGYGRALFYEMLEMLKLLMRPYYSVFGFTRVGNDEAKSFYGALGFDLQEIDGVYEDGHAILFTQSFEILLKEKRKYEDSLRS